MQLGSCLHVVGMLQSAVHLHRFSAVVMQLLWTSWKHAGKALAEVPIQCDELTQLDERRQFSDFICNPHSY